jgi:hypothetical protein
MGALFFFLPGIPEHADCDRPMRRPSTKKPSLVSQVLGGPFWIFLAVAAIGGVATWHLKGPTVVEQAVRGDLDLLVFLVPRMLGGMLLAGLVQMLLPPEMVAKWVGAESGMRGLVIASVVGVLTPGGPMTSFPIVVAFYMSGADRGALVAYITAWSILGFQRLLVWELPVLGPEITFYRLLAVFWMPVLAGLIARRLPFDPAPPAASLGSDDRDTGPDTGPDTGSGTGTDKGR